MSFLRLNSASVPVLVVLMIATACKGNDRMDGQLKADLMAASMVPSQQQFVSPMELGYGTGYGSGAYPPPPPGYVYAPAPRVVYRTAPATVRAPARRTSAPSTSSRSADNNGIADGNTGSQQAGTIPERNTKRGAVIGAATGAAVGILTSRDKVKGGAVGAIAGAVLGGVVGSQIYTKPRPNGRW